MYVVFVDTVLFKYTARVTFTDEKICGKLVALSTGWVLMYVASILSGRISQCVRATCTRIESTHISADGYEQGSKKIIL
jgi:hypothetical protein